MLFLCLLWYAVSSSSNVVGKMLLSEFPYPLTVTMVQLTSITVYSGPFFNLWGVRKYSSNITWSYYLRLIIPLALGKFLANVFSHVSIWKVPVSYAHTGMHTRYIAFGSLISTSGTCAVFARVRRCVYMHTCTYIKSWICCFYSCQMSYIDIHRISIFYSQT